MTFASVVSYSDISHFRQLRLVFRRENSFKTLMFFSLALALSSSLSLSLFHWFMLSIVEWQRWHLKTLCHVRVCMCCFVYVLADGKSKNLKMLLQSANCTFSLNWRSTIIQRKFLWWTTKWLNKSQHTHTLGKLSRILKLCHFRENELQILLLQRDFMKNIRHLYTIQFAI